MRFHNDQSRHGVTTSQGQPDFANIYTTEKKWRGEGKVQNAETPEGRDVVYLILLFSPEPTAAPVTW